MMETKPDKSNICYGCPETCGTDRPWDCPIIIKELTNAKKKIDS